MLNKITEKMKHDLHIAQAIRGKRRQMRKKFLCAAAILFAFALFISLASHLTAVGWLITWSITVLVLAAAFFSVERYARRARLFLGRIERIDEDRSIVPTKGNERFSRFQERETDVSAIIVGIMNEQGDAQVITLPPQYEKLLTIGDTLFLHSALPYPAHLSHPTQSICMHCGTMQSSENESCITCGADMYSVHTVK